MIFDNILLLAPCSLFACGPGYSRVQPVAFFLGEKVLGIISCYKKNNYKKNYLQQLPTYFYEIPLIF